jgi:transcriptional regulator with XRE-family HTH domain
MGKSTFSREYKVFCEALREAREEAGFTQEEIAACLRRPQSYISKYESGERRLDVIEFLRIVKVLKLDACEILRTIKKKCGRTAGTG